MKDQKKSWATVTLCALTGLNLLNYIDRYLLPSVATAVQKDLGLNDAQYGEAFTSFMWGYFLTSPLFGYLGDRFSRKWLIAAGVLVWSAGTMLTGQATGFVSLVIFRVLIGFGEASFGTISPGIIADLYPPEKRNNAISFFSAALPIGAALSFIIGGQISHYFGWRTAFYCVGVPGLLVAFALLKLPEVTRGASEPKGDGATQPEVAKGWRVYAQLCRIPTYLLVVAGYAAQTFAMGGFVSYVSVYFQRVHHMELSDAANFLGLSLVGCGFIGTFAGGYLGTKWRARHSAGYAWVLALSSLIALPSAFATFLLASDTGAKIALVASMFFLFMPNGPVNTVALESVPVKMRACAMAAMIFAIHFFGDLWSPQIVGMLSVHFGSATTASDAINGAALQKAALYTLPGALVLSAVFWLGLAVRMGKDARKAPTQHAT